MNFAQFLLMLISAMTLPLLAFIAIFLRKNLLVGKSRLVFIVLGVALLFFSIRETLIDHGGTLTVTDILVAIFAMSLTFFVLSKFNHNHNHSSETEGAKGIVISEAFHSLTDGAVIGATYLVNPMVGYAATLGIIIHELPKIIGTLAIFKGLGLSTKKTILYGILSQIGSPIAAILVYILGANVSEETLAPLEMASIASLLAVILWIIWLEIRHHIIHKNKNSDGHNHPHNNK